MMFNSAGLHPNTVGLSPEDLQADQGMFLQYRADGGIAQGFGDPLTGIQNSPAMQSIVYGVAKGAKGILTADSWARQTLGLPPLTDSAPVAQQEMAKDISDRLLHVTSEQAAANYRLSDGKWYIPPAVGEVRDVTSKNDDGTDSSIASQHSIDNLVNGFEFRKFADVSSLLESTRTAGDPSAYLGPTELVIH